MQKVSIDINEVLKNYKPYKRETATLYARVDRKIDDRLKQLSQKYSLRKPVIIEKILTDVLF